MNQKLVIAFVWILAGLFSACTGVNQAQEASSPDNVTQGERLFVKSVLRPPIYGVDPGGWRHSYLLLLADGIAFKALPTGLDVGGVTAEELRNLEANKLGRYQAQGNTLQIIWDDGTSWVLARTNKGWQRQSESEAYRYVPALPKNTLNAAYSRDSSAILGFGPDPATVASSSRFTFFANGRFVLDAFASGTGQGAVGVLEARYKGHYRFDGYALTLQFDDGTLQFETAFVWSDDGDSVLSLGKRLYDKTRMPTGVEP